jgi:hypothetical protein
MKWDYRLAGVALTVRLALRLTVSKGKIEPL